MRSLPGSWNKTLARLGFRRKKGRAARNASVGRRRLRVEALEDRRMLAVFTVNSIADNTIPDGFVTLREAIDFANEDDIIQFASSLDGRRITLSQGELQIFEDVTIDGTMLASGITIDASGNDSTPNSTLTDGDPNNDGNGSRIFLIGSSDVTLKGLTLTGGDVSYGGGAIHASYANLTLEQCIITGNISSLDDGGGVNFDGGSGVYDLTIRDTTISGNEAGDTGGGLYAETSFGSTTTIDQSTFDSNKIVGDQGKGGGIFLKPSGGEVEVTSTTISNNQALGFGANAGGMYLHPSLAPTVVLDGLTITSNSAEDDAGGLFIVNYSSDVTLRNSTISGNTGSNNDFQVNDQGIGGVLIISSTFYTGGSASTTIDSSEISDNRAISTPNYGQAANGGVSVLAGSNTTATIRNTTISGNSADSLGGGILITQQGGSTNGGEVFIDHSTITKNRADADGDMEGTGGGIHRAGTTTTTVTLSHTIVAGNYRGPEQSQTPDDIDGTVTAFWSLVGDNTGSNLAGAPVGNPDANGNLIGTSAAPIDPLLSELASHGGPTRTHALLPGSPAIDAGDQSFVGPPYFDQRGAPFARVYDHPVAAGTGVDIGAYEVQADTPRVTKVSIGGPNRLDGVDGFYDIPSGDGNQIRTVPIGGADIIEISFNRPMDEATLVDALSLTGAFTETVYTEDVVFQDYDPDTFTATWEYTPSTDSDMFPADQMVLTLADTATDFAGQQLDGDWTNPYALTDTGTSEFPSGDGTAEGSFEFFFTILPGDITSGTGTPNNIVGGADLLALLPNLNTLGSYLDGDLNGDGNVAGADLLILLPNQGTDFSSWPEQEEALMAGGGGSEELLSSSPSARDRVFTKFGLSLFDDAGDEGPMWGLRSRMAG